MNAIDTQSARDYFRSLQDHICDELSRCDGDSFIDDSWQKPSGSGATRVLREGQVFEQAGVAFSHVQGDSLPPAASQKRPQLAGAPWQAMGVSVVVHPRSPMIPTSHMNVRMFVATPPDGEAIWWFGGGYDLTPFYPRTEDCVAWHRCAADCLAPFGDALYPRFKAWCDDYFYLKHRQEARGIGGLFFDDFNELGFDQSFAMTQAVGNSFTEAYVPIVEANKATPYDAAQREFQRYRRGRYVEFNLVWDRGTIFGLQSGGRTESILMSMPPSVRFEYGYEAPADSPEAALTRDFLPPRDWLA